jgi:hypothetical protein
MAESWICRCSRGTLYDVLQVSQWCEPEVLQAAYRALARTRHPDVNRDPDAEEQMRRLNAAYQVLSDPARRARYDEELRLDATRPMASRTVVHTADMPRPVPVPDLEEPEPLDSFIPPPPPRRAASSANGQVASYASAGLDVHDGPVLPRSALYVSVVLVTAIVVLVLWLVIDALVDRQPPTFRGGRVGEERGVQGDLWSPWTFYGGASSQEPGLSPSAERWNR